VVLAAIEGYEGKARLSVYTIQKAILMFYTRARLYPSGIVEEHPAVQDWSLKYAIALSRLVSILNATFYFNHKNSFWLVYGLPRKGYLFYLRYQGFAV